MPSIDSLKSTLNISLGCNQPKASSLKVTTDREVISEFFAKNGK